MQTYLQKNMKKFYIVLGSIASILFVPVSILRSGAWYHDWNVYLIGLVFDTTAWERSTASELGWVATGGSIILVLLTALCYWADDDESKKIKS